MPESLSGEHLQRISQRAAEHRFFMASAFKAFAAYHGLSFESLASLLGCSLEGLQSLSLCRRPSSDSISFRADLESLGAYTSVPANKLLEILREVEAIEAFAGTASATSAVEMEQGFLMAARDRRRTPRRRTDKDDPRDDQSES